MRLLAMDAASGQCSAALLDSEVCLGAMRGGDSRGAASALPEMTAALLARHGARLDAIAVTVGPGSFTGLRAALAFAHGLALGAGIPVVGVSVAEALLGPEPNAAVWVALDARRAGRVFLGCGGAVAVASLDALPTPAGPITVVGDAAELVVAALRRAGALATVSGNGVVDQAAVGRVALQRLRGEAPPCEALPLYVDLPEARPSGARRPAPV